MSDNVLYNPKDLASIMRAIFALLLGDFPTRVTVQLSSPVSEGDVAYVDGKLGITSAAGDAGDTIELIIDHAEHLFRIPDGLEGKENDLVYIDITDLTGHVPNESAYYTSEGGNRIALVRVTKWDEGIVKGVLLPKDGEKLFWTVQGIVEKLRTKIQTAYNMQFKKKFGKQKIQPDVAGNVNIEEIALVVMGMVEEGKTIKELLKVSTRELLDIAREKKRN